MVVLELEMPGTWLDGIPAETSREITGLISLIWSSLADAALSLTYFDQVIGFPTVHRERWEQDRQEEMEATRRVEATLLQDSSGWDRPLMEAARHVALTEVRRARWAGGRLPDTYSHRLPFLHARSFVTALEGVRKALAVMQTLPHVPSTLQDVVDRLDTDLGLMKHIRDAIQHGEDRVRGKDRRNKPILLLPVDNSAVSAPHGGVLIYDQLNGRRFGCSLADGSFGEVDISIETAMRVRDAVQDVINTLVWTGPRDHVPR
jgi:hypothetical protein